VNEAVAFLLERFGHDWKDSVKKAKKEFDFFEMEKLQEREREEHRNENVDFFAEGDRQEVEQVEENIKKGEFSLSGLFSIFSWENKKKDKEREREREKSEPVRDGYEETRNILMKKSTNETKMTQNSKTLKR
jgi:hypothetical protein